VSQLAAQLAANFSVNPNPCPVVSGPSAFVVATCTFDGSSSTGAIHFLRMEHRWRIRKRCAGE
jgi:hypothetical protein